ACSTMRSTRASPLRKSSRPLPIGVKPSLQVRPPNSNARTRAFLARMRSAARRANRYTSNGEEPAMKIARVKIYLIAGGKLHPVIVEIVTDEGVSGIGEAAIAYGLGGTATAGMVKDLSERMLIGRDPFRIEEIWSEMYDHSFWAKGGGPIAFAAISGIEQA